MLPEHQDTVQHTLTYHQNSNVSLLFISMLTQQYDSCHDKLKCSKALLSFADRSRKKIILLSNIMDSDKRLI